MIRKIHAGASRALLLASDVAATLVALAAAYFLRFRAEIMPVKSRHPGRVALLPPLSAPRRRSGPSSTPSTASTRCGETARASRKGSPCSSRRASRRCCWRASADLLPRLLLVARSSCSSSSSATCSSCSPGARRSAVTRGGVAPRHRGPSRSRRRRRQARPRGRRKAPRAPRGGPARDRVRGRRRRANATPRTSGYRSLGTTGEAARIVDERGRRTRSSSRCPSRRTGRCSPCCRTSVAPSRTCASCPICSSTSRSARASRTSTACPSCT